MGNYRLLNQLAAGGMGAVYFGLLQGPEGFTKRVAVKRLHPHLESGRDEFRQRFIAEAQIGASLAHPNIVEVLDFGIEDESYFIVMEYVHGCSLGAVLKSRRASAAPPLPTGLAALIVREVLSGLQAAHEHRVDGEARPIVHRDLNPNNVMVSTNGEVKITDFGLALIGGEHLTRVRGLRGTIRYMAPEQAANRQPDERSDIFSAGLMLYELMTGERAFDGDSDAEVLKKVSRAAIPTISLEHPTALSRILAGALCTDPARRYPRAAAFRDELDAYLDGVQPRPKREELGALAGALAPEVPEAARPGGRATEPLGELSITRPPLSAPVALVCRPTLSTAVDRPLPATATDRPASASPTSPIELRRAPLVVAALILLLGALLFLLVRYWPSRGPGAARHAGRVVAAAHDLRGPDLRPAPAIDTALAVDPGRPDLRRRAPARPAHGFLTLNTMPVWSEVLVDGKRAGTTPLRRLRLPAGEHRVTLRPSGGPGSRTFTVRILPQQTETRIVTVAP